MRRPRAVAISGALAVAAALAAAYSASAQVPPPGTLRRPAPAEDRPGEGVTVVPDRFLRSWDPVTVFFERDVGGGAGEPEDDPGRLVKLSPPHPGAFTWVDPRTLQFRPADPWPPLARFTIEAGGETASVHTLMSPPVRTIPAAGATGLDPVESITLVYRDPFSAEDLARMVTLELRPLPGIAAGPDGARWLTRDDFEVKTLERKSRDDEATFVLLLETPIPVGTRAVVHQRLSLDDDSSRSFVELAFATVEPFRVTAVGTRSTRFPVTPGGSRYTADQAIDGGSDDRAVVVELSAEPQPISPVEARNLVRFDPAVDNLSYRVSGRTLRADGDFDWDTPYRVTVAPTPIRDARDRPLDLRAPSVVYVFFPRRPAFLRLLAGGGSVESAGPRMVPVEGRGQERFDLRIHPVDPLDRSFWPFPPRPVVVDEGERPPGPGETPPPHAEARHISEQELRAQLRTLGSPSISSMVELPLRKEGSSARFGLDLAPHLERLAPPGAPGHYLVGLRPLDAGSERQWMRLQVTDLAVATVEQRGGVRLMVTSLATASPVAGAEVRMEGSRSGSGWSVLASGTTDAQGAFELPPFAPRKCKCTVRRIAVTRGDDTLVLDATRPPDTYADNNWTDDRRTWLHEPPSAPEPENVSHVFTERPVYRPDEPVHVKGYVRRRFAGRLEELALTRTFVVVEGPGNLVWRYPVELTETGSFYREFHESDRPTGDYQAHLQGRLPGGSTFLSSRVSFKLEAYRLPRFEVNLHAADRVPLDRDFEVSLTATYYAGGRVAERPVRWRVTQFPYTWRPRGRQGFYFSSDARFSRSQRFEASAAIDREDATDDEGSASLVLNPAVEPTAQPRTYVVEATVTGADDQTVTSTRRVVALPPFVLGMKVARYLERAEAIEPQVLVLDADGEPVAGQRVTVRLLHRQWHSYLRASDFSDGEARYVTDVVDEEVTELEVESDAEPVAVKLPIVAAGVYVVELTARDRVGRAQTVAVDLFAGGDEPVTWSRPTSRVFAVKTDKDRYDPGEEAVFVLESPFQRAEALAVVEAPEGNRYHRLPVRGGKATFRLEVLPTWVPKLPVHFVLMRGRVEGSGPLPGAATDLGKPATLASTSWIQVEPRDNRVEVDLEHPQKSLPGRTIDVTVRLRDPDGAPLAGEVTLWLVDQAVLALGKEQRLDPLPDFITPVRSHLWLRDTRNLPFGFLPFAENPGGDGMAERPRGILDRATVRRNFQPVPFYDPRIQVGPGGERTVRVELPDNLTNFKLRVKATSGLERFGFGAGHLEVRLPVIIQPALPRFVRPGDRFLGAALGRVVEGEGGPGAGVMRVEGARLVGEARREVTWVPNRPHRFEFPIEVPTPRYDDEGRLETTEAVFAAGVERLSDGATDAFEVRVPIRDDRRVLVRRTIEELLPGGLIELPPVMGEARPGTVRRDVLVSSQPALVRMAAGLSFLLEYPHGCTEQRLSRARGFLALEGFRDRLVMLSSQADHERAVADALEWIPDTVDGNGLVGYWPGSRGYVSLTAWTLQFLVEARDAGFTVDEALFGRLAASLEQAMRSDYRWFIDGESFAERAWALTALTRAGRFSPAYAAELARQAQFLDLESTAQVLRAFAASGQGTDEAMQRLAAKLWDGIVVRLHQDREIYGGLQRGGTRRNGLILPSETRSLAEATNALAAYRSGNPRLQVLVDGLVTLGRGEGWGSTNANASALLALTEVLKAPTPGAGDRRLWVTFDGDRRGLALTPDAPIAHLTSTRPEPGRVELVDGGGEGQPTVVRAETRWKPLADGSRVEAESRGFVVTRELQHVQEGGAPPRRLGVEGPGETFRFAVGDVIEDHVQVVSPSQRHYVAVVVPLAAGMEPLNPRLATAPPEARPSGELTLEPTYAAYLDDSVAFYYDRLPKGTYDFYFRLRANVPGSFVQPAASAEDMYDEAVRGNSHGARVEIVAREEE